MAQRVRSADRDVKVWSGSPSPSRKAVGVSTGGCRSTSSVRWGSPEISAATLATLERATRHSIFGSSVGGPVTRDDRRPCRRGLVRRRRTGPLPPHSANAETSVVAVRSPARLSAAVRPPTAIDGPWSMAASSNRRQRPRGVIAAATRTLVSAMARGATYVLTAERRAVRSAWTSSTASAMAASPSRFARSATGS